VLVAYYFPGIVMAVFAVIMTLVVYHFTGQVSVKSLRAWLTLAIMGLPSLIVLGYWMGAAQSRGYLMGATEKIARQVPPVVYEPQSYTQIASPQITHQPEALNAAR
jgi:heme A synthase